MSTEYIQTLKLFIGHDYKVPKSSFCRLMNSCHPGSPHKANSPCSTISAYRSSMADCLIPCSTCAFSTENPEVQTIKFIEDNSYKGE